MKGRGIDITKPFQAVQVNWSFYFAIPKYVPTRDRSTWIGSLHVAKPDASNLIKFAEDALNGLLWEDDRLICRGQFFKAYSIEPRTEIKVFPLADMNLPPNKTAKEQEYVYEEETEYEEDSDQDEQGREETSPPYAA